MCSYTINFLIRRISSDLLVQCGLQAYRHNYLVDFRFTQEKIGCMRRPEVTESPDMDLSGAAVTLTSASSCGGVHTATFRDRDGCEVLCSCGMDSDQVVEVCLGGSHLQGDAESLSDFTGIGTKVVETNHLLILSLESDELQVAVVLRPVGDRPLQGPEVLVVDLDVLLPVHCDGVLLCQAAAAVLQGREHGGAHVDVVSQQVGDPGQAPGQQLARLDGHGGQLGLAVQDVADGEDVLHIGLLPDIMKHLAVLGVQSNADLIQPEVAGAGVSANGEDDGVELIHELSAVIVLGGHLQLGRGPVLDLLDLGGHALPDEVDPVLLHELPDLARHLLVKPPEEDAPHHHSRVDADTLEEAGALQGDVAGAHKQRLARVVGQREDVVRGDAELRPGNLRVPGPAPGGEDELGRGHGALLPLLVDGLERVPVYKGGVLVEVVHLLLPQRHPVAPVEAPDVVLDLGDHGGPVVAHLLPVHLPAEALGVLDALPEERGLVHQLLGDAPDIDAGPAQAPGGPSGARLDEVTHGDLLAEPGGLLAGGQAPGAPAYHDDVVVVVVAPGVDLGQERVIGVKSEGVLTAPDVVAVDEDVRDGSLTTLLRQRCLDGGTLGQLIQLQDIIFDI